MKLREIAYSRSGDKGDVSNICVFPYRGADWELVRDHVTVEAVAALFGPLVGGSITRYELPKLHGLNFVMTRALSGGVAMTLRTDGHGKAYGSLVLDLDLPAGAGTPDGT